MQAAKNAAGWKVELDGCFGLEAHPKNAVILRPGDSGRIYLVRSGRVRLLSQRGLSPALVSILRPGDVFGELFEPESRPAKVTAVSSGGSEVWSIDRQEFLSQVEANPRLASLVLRAYAERVGALRQRVVELAFKEVPARLAETLLGLFARHGEDRAPNGQVGLRGVSHQDLADLVGASRTFISLLISQLKTAGVLRSVGRTLFICDEKALRAIAAGDRPLRPSRRRRMGKASARLHAPHPVETPLAAPPAADGIAR